MQKFYEIRALAADSETAEVFIYGDIGESWSGESVTARQFVEQIAAIKASGIVVRINSYGGSVSDGLAIYNALRRHPASITVHVDGVAVSIASLIAMAGDRIEMAENAMFMIHAPWGAVSGNAVDLREYAELLDRYSESMVSAYAGRLPEATVRAILADGEDHWYSAPEALDIGLADAAYAGAKIAASLPPDRFKIPLTEETAMPTTTTTTDPIAAERARINDRNRDIIQSYAGFASYEGIAALQAEVLADVSLSVQQANDRLLAHLAKDAEPLAASDHSHLHGGQRVTTGDNSHHKDFAAAASDALLLRAGFQPSRCHPAARDLRGMSLVDMAKTMVGHRGLTLAGGNPNAVIKAAMSTSDFPVLLANTATKALMLGYESEPASHRAWTREVEVDNFKAVSRVATSSAPALEEVIEGGEYRHGYLSERSEAYQLKTYGKVLEITRRAIINDDLGGFTRIPKAFGQSAARLEADKVYALLTDNPTMADGIALFHADHGNLVTASAISIDGLAAARAVMRKQKSFDGGGYLNIVPSFLIVPASLETMAEQVVASIQIGEAGAANGSTMPAWVRSLTVVVDPRLDAASGTAWYLAASVNQVDTIEVAHLVGQRGVFTDDETDFNTDNYRIKARLDFAAHVIDWVGLVKNPGA